MKNKADLQKASDYKFVPKAKDPVFIAALEAAERFIRANLSGELEYHNGFGRIGFNVTCEARLVQVESADGVIDRQYITLTYFIDLTQELFPQIETIKAKLSVWAKLDKLCYAREKSILVDELLDAAPRKK